ncbi:hypothetical protein PQR67_26545 [Paraburkholderia fungorum]|uniref:hypothetical protein n=1 Tax=Paraburkholderia fungorum TaxID=134537 RepID=UPI0038BABED9
MAVSVGNKHEEFAMLRHLVPGGADRVPSTSATAFKKNPIERRIPATRAVKETEAQRSRFIHILTALKADAANAPQ